MTRGGATQRHDSASICGLPTCMRAQVLGVAVVLDRGDVRSPRCPGPRSASCCCTASRARRSSTSLSPRPCAAAGFPVERPEMCWSGRRIYDRDYLDCLRDIDSADRSAEGDGARRRSSLPVTALARNGALAYGARKAVKGVVALAPGHRPEVLATSAARSLRIWNARAGLSPKAAAIVRRALPTINGSLVITVTATPAALPQFLCAGFARRHAGQRRAAERTAALRRGQR